jgi:hypothetical protein
MNSYDLVLAVKSAPRVTDMSETDLSFCENEELYIFVAADGNVNYQWYFEGEAIPGATLHYYATIFTEAKAGEYHVEISNECGTLTYYFNVMLNPTVIKLKWDDVMYVENTRFAYVSYQWYKDGIPIAEFGQDQYYSETGGFESLAEYNVRAYKADGTYDEACPIVPNDGSKASGSSLSIYPNPTQSGHIVSFLLKLPEGEWADANAYIYDMNGKIVTQLKITNMLTEVKLDVAAGAYTVKVITDAGNEFVDKLIIK